MTIKDLRTYGTKILSDVSGKKKSPTPALDTDVILESLLGCDKTFLLFHGEVALTQEQQAAFVEAIQKRTTGLPVAYITGHKEFFGYDFLVNQSTLIPKPDTELLVERALEEIRRRTKEKPGAPITICDMCSGTGCVGLSIIKACAEQAITPQNMLPSLTLCDISAEALELSRKNSRELLAHIHSATVHFVQSNLFERTGGKFDLITANPPYIPANETAELLLDGRSEPALALNGDVEKDGSRSAQTDGLSVMRRLVPEAYAHLEKNGMLLAESGEYNAEGTISIFLEAGFGEVSTFCDMAGLPRVTSGKKMGFDNNHSI